MLEEMNNVTSEEVKVNNNVEGEEPFNGVILQSWEDFVQFEKMVTIAREVVAIKVNPFRRFLWWMKFKVRRGKVGGVVYE